MQQPEGRLISRRDAACRVSGDGASPVSTEKDTQGDTMSFGIYAIGFAILIGGLIYGAHLMHMPAHWIAVGAIVLLGIGILSGVKATRQRDPSE
jgi:hypothetical protein